MLIKHKLIANTGLLVLAMVLMLGLLAYASNALQHDIKVATNIGQIESSVLELRRDEKDFLARKELKYSIQFTKDIQELQQQINLLQQSFENSGLQLSEFAAMQAILTTYHKHFQTIVATQQRIGLTPTDGLYGELRKAVHNVESLIGDSNFQLRSEVLQLRRNEKDFMLRRDAKYLTVFDEQMTHFYKDIDNADLTGDTATRIKASLDIYKEKFLNLAKAEKAIGLNAQSGLLGQLRGTITQTEDSLSAIKSKLETSLEQAISAATITAIIVFIGAMIFVMVVVYYTSQSIISPILAVRNAISHIRTKKDLTWLVKTKGKGSPNWDWYGLNIILRPKKQLSKR